MPSTEQSTKLQIRNATTEQHSALESHPLSMKLKMGSISKEEYSTLLVGFTKSIRSFRQNFSEMSPRFEMASLFHSAFELLEQSLIMDLNALGVQSANLKLQTNEKFNNPLESIGAAYVILSGSYGAKIALDKISANRGSEVRFATRYLRALVHINPMLLQRASEIIEIEQADPEKFKSITGGANKMFANFKTALDSAQAEFSQ